MEYICQHCRANLDDGDIFEFFLSEYVNYAKARETARLYGWTETNKKHFTREIIVQSNNNDLQYTICPNCNQKDPLPQKK